MDTNPAVTEAEPSDEPIMTSEQWPETLVEHVWAFLLSMLYRDRTPHDLSRLRSIDWSEIFPARKFSWENQTMQVVQLPGSEPAWLVVHPQVWNQISAFVEWVQHRNPRQVEDPQPLFVPLDGGLQKQIEELLEEAWPGLTNLGVRSLTLMHLNGQLVSWKSLDGYESAAFMGRAAVRDLVLTRHLNALVHAEAEPMIKLTYERSPIFNPAQAAGTRVVSTSETLIHDAWLLVIGWAADRQLQGQQQFFTQIQANLEALLPN